MTKIYIDCSLIDFSRQPTGIPRVVLKYIETGYAWAARENLEVIPAGITPDGMMLVRPVPGANAPAKLVERAEKSNHFARRQWEIGKRKVSNYFRQILHHLVKLLVSIIPFRRLRHWAGRLNHQIDVLQALIAKPTVPEEVKNHLTKDDIVFFPAYWHDVPSQHFHNIKKSGASIVILVHDLLPILNAPFYHAPWKYEFAENVRNAFSFADAFFCISEFTRDALANFAKAYDLKSPPMLVAYNGYEPLASASVRQEIEAGTYKPLASRQAKWDYFREHNPFIMVGSVEPKKGHIPVIRNLEIMWALGFERHLTVIGRPGWLEKEVVEAIKRSPFYGSKLFWFTDLDDPDLLHAYLHCKALIFASVAEGFGLPMIEAANLKKPTIVYDTIISREILGDYGYFFQDAASFTERCQEVNALGEDELATKFADWQEWPNWDEIAPHIFDAMLKVPAGTIKSGLIATRDGQPVKQD